MQSESTITPVSPTREHRADRKWLYLTVGILVLANLGLAHWAYGKWVVEAEHQQLIQLTQTEAQRQAQSVNAHLAALTAQVNQLASRPDLAAALAERDKERLTALGSRLQETMANAVAIRLLPLDTARLDRKGKAPIRFAELDMIHHAEKREAVKPEAAKIDDHWLLNMVAPLPADDRQPVVGAVLVSFAGDVISRPLQAFDGNLGRTELLQQFDQANPQLLTAQGRGDAGPAQEAAVPGSYWMVRFTPSPQLAEQARVNPLPLFGALLAIALVSIAAGSCAAQPLSCYIQRRYAPKAAPAATETLTTATAPSGESSLTNPIYHQDILDIEVAEEDENLLGLGESSATASDKDVVETAAEDTGNIPEAVFRAYDIRGIVGSQLTPELVEMIGQAVASEALDLGETTIFVGRDGRSHSPDITERLVKAILSTGCNVIDIGVVPTPLLYYAACESSDTQSGIMVTASHNAAEYNGFKMMLKGRTLADDDIQQLRSRILRRHFHWGQGHQDFKNVVPDYIDRVFSDVALAGEITIVIDAGNGATGEVAPRLFEELGCEVIPLHCEIDGRFPNHDPDPTQEENLRDLVEKVRETQADLGVAFDGDGDRIMVVTPHGEIIWPDRLLMLFAKDIVSRCPGADVIFDVKCTRSLNSLITSYGGRPIMWKAGHSHMKSKMIENDAMLGGEYSGHIFIRDRWYGFDDGMYAAARLIEIMSLRDQDLDSIFASFPVLPSTPEIRIAVAEEQKFGIIRTLIDQGNFEDGKCTTVDGLRVDFAKGWGLVRASNTAPALTLRFEGETQKAIAELQQIFKRELLKADASLAVDF